MFCITRYFPSVVVDKQTLFCVVNEFFVSIPPISDLDRLLLT